MVDELYMAWRGHEDDQTMWYSRLLDDPLPIGSQPNWTRQAPIAADRSTLTAPALAPMPGDPGGLIMAWRGHGGNVWDIWLGNPGDRAIWYSIFDGRTRTWSAQQAIPGIGSSNGPALAAYGGLVHMVWRGIDDDNNIYHCAYSPRSGEWSAFRNATQDVVPGCATYTVPALATFQDQLHMVWRGAFADHTIWHAVFDRGSGWSRKEAVSFPSNVGCSIGMALAAYNGRLHMAWNGWEDLTPGFARQRMWHNTFDGARWGRPTDLETYSAMPPAMAALNGRLYLVWRGAVDVVTMGSGQGYQGPKQLPDKTGKAPETPEDVGGAVSVGGQGPVIQDQHVRCRYYVVDQWDDRIFVFNDRETIAAPALAVRSIPDDYHSASRQRGNVQPPAPTPDPRSSRLPFDLPPVIVGKPPLHGQ